MTAEQEAIERLREWMPHVDRGISWTTSHQADLRALLDSHERLRLALEQLQRAVQRVCEQGLVEEAGLWLLDLTLEGNNE